MKRNVFIAVGVLLILVIFGECVYLASELTSAAEEAAEKDASSETTVEDDQDSDSAEVEEPTVDIPESVVRVYVCTADEWQYDSARPAGTPMHVAGAMSKLFDETETGCEEVLSNTSNNASNILELEGTVVLHLSDDTVWKIDWDINQAIASYVCSIQEYVS